MSPESLQPPPNESDDAIIRDIMNVKGVSFAEARKEWEMQKAKGNMPYFKNKEDKEES